MLGHWIYDDVMGAVGLCSLLHSLLPPWEFLDDFPRAQKFYKVFIYVIGYVGINARSTVYQSISEKRNG